MAIDPHSSGTFVDASGVAHPSAARDFSLEPERYWTSPKTKARYPVGWRILVPSLALDLRCDAAMDQQELVARIRIRPQLLGRRGAIFRIREGSWLPRDDGLRQACSAGLVTHALATIWISWPAGFRYLSRALSISYSRMWGWRWLTCWSASAMRSIFPEAQTCCGQPAFNSGFQEEARQVARHFLSVFSGADYVVVPSGSCCSMISHHFTDIFQKEPANLEASRALAPEVWEFSSFLTEVAQVDDVGAKLEEVVTYHDSCHALRELKIKQGPRRLLSKVRGLELREMDIAEECCGFGGTFSVKFDEVSGGMARTKIDSIVRTGATTVVSHRLQLSYAIARRAGPRGAAHPHNASG